MKKVFCFITVLAITTILFNLRVFASNSYYLMSCIENKIPSNYYDEVDTSSEERIRESLCNITMNNYIANSYDKAFLIDSYADADPYNEGNISCIYTGLSIKNELHGTSGWDREHIWCKSHGFKPRNKKGEYKDGVVADHAYNDCHHLRAAEHIINIKRSDKDFGEVLNPKGIDEYGSKWDENVFEPRDEVKGDIARMLFYMVIRYGKYSSEKLNTYIKNENNEWVFTSFDLNLELVDETTTSISDGNGRLGKLSTLLKWHYQDPVSNREIYRNNVIYMYQNNRNPFIDHPEYVDLAFENEIGKFAESTKEDLNIEDDINREIYLERNISFEADENFSLYNSSITDLNPIEGNHSLLLTNKKNTKGLPQAFMLDYVSNLSKVTFKAKSSLDNTRLKLMYSCGDTNYLDGETFILSKDVKEYTSILSNNGGFGNARIGFSFEDQDIASIITIDDINIYAGKNSPNIIFENNETKTSLNMEYDIKTKETERTYYKRVESLDEIEDGKPFIIGSSNLDKYPYVMNNYNDKDGRFMAIKPKIENDLIFISNPTTFTLCDGIEKGSYSIKVGNNYLGNDTNKKTRVSLLDEISLDSSWTIEINSGIAKIELLEDSNNKDRRRILSFKDTNTNQYFTCYQGKQTDNLAIYKEVIEDYIDYEYSIKKVSLEFYSTIDISLYNDILELDDKAIFGIAVSSDGINYNNEVLTLSVTENEDEVFIHINWVINNEEYDTIYYAKTFVIINGNTYYMKEAIFSVESLRDYYNNNIDLSKNRLDILSS